MAITKCPNCNNKVSTLALKCPHCNTSVAGNLSYCPECNDAYINGSTICPSCGFGLIETVPTADVSDTSNNHLNEPSEYAYAPREVSNTPENICDETNEVYDETNDVHNESEDIYDATEETVDTTEEPVDEVVESEDGDETNEDANEPDEETSEDDDNASNKHNIFAISIIVGIILLGLAIGGTLYYKYMLQNEEETLAYTQLQQNFAPNTANAFLKTYPDSKYADSLRIQLKEYDEQSKAWQHISESSKREDFVTYINNHKTGYFLKTAEAKLDSIDWSHTKQNATPDAIKFYMDNHANGKHIEVARAGLNAINAYRVNYPERSAVNNAIMRFFMALSNSTPDMLTNITSPAVYATANSLITKADKANTTRYSITSTIDIDKDITNDGNTYSTSCVVLRTVTTPDRNITKKSFYVKARLDNDYKIQVLSMSTQTMSE